MKLEEKRKLRLQEAKILANKNNGDLLSCNYINAHKPLQWRCKENHIWNAPFHSVRRGSWCKQCYHFSKRLSYEEVKATIEKQSFTLITDHYINANQKLDIKCPEGHLTTVRASSLLHIHVYCSICNSTKPSLDVLHEWAKRRGGKLLSTDYKSEKQNLLWECNLQHKWEANWDRIFHGGSWCPECKTGIGERICRLHFEQLFNAPFTRKRPSWLRNSNGFLMELDGYNEQLKLAFEHQGRHHTQVDYHSNKLNFEKRLKYDLEKKYLCNKVGVTLICIPELFKITPLKELKTFILNSLPEKLASFIDISKEIDLTKAYTLRSIEQLEKAQKYAISRKGACLSAPQEYLTNKSYLRWECELGHTCKAKYNTIVDGEQWCPKCRKFA